MMQFGFHCKQKNPIIISPQPDIDNYNYNYYITDFECEYVYSYFLTVFCNVVLNIFLSNQRGEKTRLTV